MYLNYAITMENTAWESWPLSNVFYINSRLNYSHQNFTMFSKHEIQNLGWGRAQENWYIKAFQSHTKNHVPEVIAYIQNMPENHTCVI